MQLDVGGITPEELADLIAVGAAPNLIDVCIEEDFACDPALIPGAERQKYREIESDRDTVVICQRGLKLSMGAAALLRSKGIAATHLIGGNVAWREAGLPRLDASALPSSRLWVTARGSVSCGVLRFLIHRFLDRGTHLLAVDGNECEAVAERFEAKWVVTPVDWLRQSGLNTPALLALLTEAADEGTPLYAMLQAARTLPNPESASDAILTAVYATHRKAGTL
jgi:rhodanese-related sulfurtransferase